MRDVVTVVRTGTRESRSTPPRRRSRPITTSSAWSSVRSDRPMAARAARPTHLEATVGLPAAVPRSARGTAGGRRWLARVAGTISRPGLDDQRGQPAGDGRRHPRRSRPDRRGAAASSSRSAMRSALLPDDQTGPLEEIGLVAAQLGEQHSQLVAAAAPPVAAPGRAGRRGPGPVRCGGGTGVPAPRPRRPLDQAGDVGHHEVQAGPVRRRRPGLTPEMWLEGGERIVGDLGLGRGHRWR